MFVVSGNLLYVYFYLAVHKIFTRNSLIDILRMVTTFLFFSSSFTIKLITLCISNNCTLDRTRTQHFLVECFIVTYHNTLFFKSDDMQASLVLLLITHLP